MTSDEKRRIQVLFFVGAFPHPGNSSGGSFNQRAVTQLREHVDVTVVSVRQWLPRRPALERVTSYEYPVYLYYCPFVSRRPDRLSFQVNVEIMRWHGWRTLRHLLAEADLVHTSGVFHSSVAAGLLAARAGKRHVAQIIGSDVNDVHPRLAGSRIIDRWLPCVDYILPTSHALGRTFEALYPDGPPVETIYRGVPLQVFRPIEATSARDRQGAQFLFLGGFPNLSWDKAVGFNKKGGETLLAAWKAAEPSLTKLGATLEIGGPRSDIPLVAQWRESLESQERVTILGPVDIAEIPEAMQRADVVLVPSLNEGLPNVAMEAAASARTVLASRVGGVPEIVIEGETGFLLPPDDPSAWAEKLVELAGDRERLKRIGAAARTHVERHFDSAHFAPQVVSMYESVLGARSNDEG